MPSSLIIVALAAAWLVVLVPMVARRRQEVARTADSALAARVVHSGGRAAESQEVDMADDEPDDFDASHDVTESDDDIDEYDDEPEPESPRARPAGIGTRTGTATAYSGSDEPSRYRPGRGGFDPEAAEIAAKAKYAHRQRIVIGLLITAVVTALVAGIAWSAVWWLHALVDVTLIGYLGYLRRQVRIEEEVRQRRLARLAGTRTRRPAPPAAESTTDALPQPGARAERTAEAEARISSHAVVVDLDDEDPAFHELDDPANLPYRRAVGE